MASSSGYELAATTNSGGFGKIRRKPIRRINNNNNPSPYDRPSMLTAPSSGGGWISKLIDPASRVISRSAHKLFSSVFQKPPPRLLPSSDAKNEGSRFGKNVLEGNNGHLFYEDQGDINNGGLKQFVRSDHNGINELVNILQQKTFSRTEIEHLTELLHSRTDDILGESNLNRYASSSLQSARNQDSRERANSILQENKAKKQLLPVSSYGRDSNFVEQKTNSPEELAQAYMGSRLSKCSPLNLGLRNPSKGALGLQTNISFAPVSTNVSLAPKSAVFTDCLSENGNVTSKPRGRSAIYNMVRTPYSRSHYSGTPKIDTVADPLKTSESSWQKFSVSVGSQGLKRRRSTLYSDIGSVGPIRRIRQKASMMSSPSTSVNFRSNGNKLINQTIEPGSESAYGSTRQLLVDDSWHNLSNMKRAENGDKSFANTDLAFVPSQSSNTAKKILLQLDKLTSPLKEKSSEVKLALARGKMPSELTVNMLQGQALKSVKDVDSSKVILDLSGTLSDGFAGSQFPNSKDISKERDRCEKNALLKASPIPQSILKDDDLDGSKSLKETLTISSSVPVTERKKKTFQMSAHEDFLELDDDNNFDPSPPMAEKNKLDTSALGDNLDVHENLTKEISSSEVKLIEKSVHNKETLSSPMNGTKDDCSSTYSVADTSSTSTQNNTFVSPSLLSCAIRPQFVESVAAAVISHNTKISDKDAAPVSFSTAGILSDSEQKIPYSNIHGATAAELSSRAAESDKNAETEDLISGELLKASESSTSVNLSTSVSPISFAFGGSASQTSVNIDISSPAASTAVEVSTPVISTSISGIQPFSFQSGTSTTSVPSNSTSLSAPAESKNVEPKTKKLSFGNNPFGVVPSIFSSSGGKSDPFAFGVGGSSSTSNKSLPCNVDQSSNILSGSLFGGQGTSGGTESRASSSTQSMPSQLSSSVPFLKYELSGSSTSSLTSASEPAFNFGSSSLTTFSTSTSSLTSAPTATNNLFNFSSSSPKPLVFGNGFSSSSAPTFSFGATSAAAPVVPTAPVTFGSGMTSSSGSVFSFNSASAGAGATLNPFGLSTPSNEQMNMEDSMAEDTIQASTPNNPPFGQPISLAPPSNFMFSSPAPSGGPSMFQFGGLQNPGAPPQNVFPFAATSNLELGNNTGSFSLGTSGGGDKSGRRIVKVKRSGLKRR